MTVAAGRMREVQADVMSREGVSFDAVGGAGDEPGPLGDQPGGSCRRRRARRRRSRPSTSSPDDANGQLRNQAFFTKAFIGEDNELRVEHYRPFEMLLGPSTGWALWDSNPQPTD